MSTHNICFCPYQVLCHFIMVNGYISKGDHSNFKAFPSLLKAASLKGKNLLSLGANSSFRAALLTKSPFLSRVGQLKRDLNTRKVKSLQQVVLL